MRVIVNFKVLNTEADLKEYGIDVTDLNRFINIFSKMELGDKIEYFVKKFNISVDDIDDEEDGIDYSILENLEYRIESYIKFLIADFYNILDSNELFRPLTHISLLIDSIDSCIYYNESNTVDICSKNLSEEYTEFVEKSVKSFVDYCENDFNNTFDDRELIISIAINLFIKDKSIMNILVKPYKI